MRMEVDYRTVAGADMESGIVDGVAVVVVVVVVVCKTADIADHYWVASVDQDDMIVASNAVAAVVVVLHHSTRFAELLFRALVPDTVDVAVVASYSHQPAALGAWMLFAAALVLRR